MNNTYFRHMLAERLYHFLLTIAITGWVIHIASVAVHFVFGVNFEVETSPNEYAIQTANKLCKSFNGYHKESMLFKTTYNSKYGVQTYKFTFSCTDSDAKMSVVYYE